MISPVTFNKDRNSETIDVTRNLKDCIELLKFLQNEEYPPTMFEKDQEFINSLLQGNGSEKNETFETQQTSQASDALSKNTVHSETQQTQPIWGTPQEPLALDKLIENMKAKFLAYKTNANEQGLSKEKPHHPENIHQVFFQIQMVLKILIQQMLHNRRGHFLGKNKGKDINLFFTI